jgi:hypothetical protein
VDEDRSFDDSLSIISISSTLKGFFKGLLEVFNDFVNEDLPKYKREGFVNRLKTATGNFIRLKLDKV